MYTSTIKTINECIVYIMSKSLDFLRQCRAKHIRRVHCYLFFNLIMNYLTKTPFHRKWINVFQKYRLNKDLIKKFDVNYVADVPLSAASRRFTYILLVFIYLSHALNLYLKMKKCWNCAIRKELFRTRRLLYQLLLLWYTSIPVVSCHSKTN